MSMIPFNETEMGRALLTIRCSLEHIRCLMETEQTSPELISRIENVAAESLASVGVIYDCISRRQSEMQEMQEQLRYALERITGMQKEADAAQEHAHAAQEQATLSLDKLLSCLFPSSNIIY